MPPQGTEKNIFFNPAVCLYSSKMWIILSSGNIKCVNSIGKNVFICSMVRKFHLCGIHERRWPQSLLSLSHVLDSRYLLFCVLVIQ